MASVAPAARALATRASGCGVERDGDALHITLTRPEVRNALDTAMRDQLVEAFELARLDDSITEVHLRGEGPAFCAGGDLDEFGSRPDPATAHLVRILQSAGRAIDAVADRVTAHVHGACRGSGVELPAFAGRVVASADATFGLPEVSLGLIPGAGGTVSLPRRIGRHRTALLALTGEPIDAPTARLGPGRRAGPTRPPDLPLADGPHLQSIWAIRFPFCHGDGILTRMRLRRIDHVAQRLEALGYPRAAAVACRSTGTLLHLDGGRVLCTEGERGTAGVPPPRGRGRGPPRR